VARGTSQDVLVQEHLGPELSIVHALQGAEQVEPGVHAVVEVVRMHLFAFRPPVLLWYPRLLARFRLEFIVEIDIFVVGVDVFDLVR